MVQGPRTLMYGVASRFGLNPGRSVANATHALEHPLAIRLQTAEQVLSKYPNPEGIRPVELVARVVTARRLRA